MNGLRAAASDRRHPHLRWWPPTYLAAGETGPEGLNPFPGPEIPDTIQQLLRQAGFDYQSPATALPSPEANGVRAGISEQHAITLEVDHINGRLRLLSAHSGPLANVIPDRSGLAAGRIVSYTPSKPASPTRVALAHSYYTGAL
jgi:hypothetical protein